MEKIFFILAVVSLSLFAEAESSSETKIIKEDGTEINVKAVIEMETVANVTETYRLSGESDFYLDAALVDYSELTDCEEDAKDQMAEEAMAHVDLCPTHNIDIRLAHPIEIIDVEVTSRKLTNDECLLSATYTLSTLPREEMKEIDAVCKEAYDGYGASLMLEDGLWQAIQIGFGVGYSGGGVAEMEGDFGIGSNQVFTYEYVGAPLITADAAYLYKLPVANLYAVIGGELGWVAQQSNTLSEPKESNGVWRDGGSPYIFRVGFNGGLGYRYHMRYDFQAQLGYQFQYLYRTLSDGNTV
jgi:hypothetical protein